MAVLNGYGCSNRYRNGYRVKTHFGYNRINRLY